MSGLRFGIPGSGDNGFRRWAEDALRQVEQAEDVEDILSEFSFTGTLTERRTIDAGTATLAELRDFVCTMISDIKKGGQKRSE
jgi:hypothetical protein